ncbi:hypothetical protein ESOMN_v1c02410 [Williamsoniiplasma somnilux]|uniref:Uncharacterized protein n=1 Tax=Williamsoniiplasma somnilux TaxID=215578 RepID=A0A2K8NXQ9_9MOLU|nr:hypothetical protein ESOMN_v1c02410 [Williamsoniiplasma somnilux]
MPKIEHIKNLYLILSISFNKGKYKFFKKNE